MTSTHCCCAHAPRNLSSELDMEVAASNRDILTFPSPLSHPIVSPAISITSKPKTERSVSKVLRLSEPKPECSVSKVLRLPELNECPINNLRGPTCTCYELFCSPHIVRKIRFYYYKICSNLGRKHGNAFLRGCLIPKNDNYSRWTFSVPWFPDQYFLQTGYHCRRFYMCASQFRALFGIKLSRYHRLIKDVRKEIGNPYREYYWEGEHFAIRVRTLIKYSSKREAWWKQQCLI